MSHHLSGAFSRKVLAFRAEQSRNHAISMVGLLRDAEESAAVSESQVDRDAALAAVVIIGRYIARLNETADEWESAAKGLQP